MAEGATATPEILEGLSVTEALGDPPPPQPLAPGASLLTEAGQRAAEHQSRPAGRWSLQVKYDPDKGSRAEDLQVSAGEYARRFSVLKGDRPTDDKRLDALAVSVPGQPRYLPVEVSGTIMEPHRETRRWKPVDFTSKAELQQFHESDTGKRKLWRESFGGDFFDGSPPSSFDATRLIDNEFIPITAGPFNKQLYIYDYPYMHARAFELVNHNAMAAAAVKILTRFTLGRGLTFHIKDDRAKRIWQGFWRENNMRVKIRQIARDLGWQGEMMLSFDDLTHNRSRVQVIDPSTCWEVVTDPEDVDKVYYYHFQYPTPYQIWTQGQIPSTRYIIKEVPPTNIEHLKLNVSATERRGRSDLLAAMPWFKRFNDYYSGLTVKAILEANLVWKVKVKGDQNDVDAIAGNPAMTELPPPGGIWVENEQVTLTAVSAQLTTSRSSSGVGGELASIIAASMNLPNEYFNIEASRGAARATALVRTDPAVKTIEERQQIIRELCESLYVRRMALAFDRGELPLQAVIAEPDSGPDPEQEPDRQTDEEDYLASQAADHYAQAVLARKR